MFDVLDKLAVREFVASLPRRDRRLAELLMAGYSHGAAAERLGIAVRTVRHRVLRIRQRYDA